MKIPKLIHVLNISPFVLPELTVKDIISNVNTTMNLNVLFLIIRSLLISSDLKLELQLVDYQNSSLK